MRKCPKKKIYESDYLRGRLWYWGVKDASELPTATAIEHVVSPETFRRRKSESGGYIYPAYFSKIKRGEKPAGKKLVRKTDIFFPGTRYWYEHPFWDVIRHKDPFRASIAWYVKRLKSENAKSLLFPFPGRQIATDAKATSDYIQSTFKKLHNDSDLDALTALIIFLQMARKLDTYDREFAHLVSEQILVVFKRFAAQSPIFHVKDELFEYINRHFIELIEDSRPAYEIIDGDTHLYIEINHMVLDFLDELDALRCHSHAPASCLAIVERHMDIRDLAMMLEEGVPQKEILDMPVMKVIARDLEAWEREKIFS